MNTISAEDDIIKTDVLKARENTLVFYNTIYQISNISEIRAIDLSTEKNMPRYYWVFLVVGLVLLITEQIVPSIFGVLSLAIFGYLVFRYNKTKINEKYGLYISMNSGRYTIIASKNFKFVMKVALTLQNIMNKQGGSVNFNFENNTINEVEASSGAVIVTGEVNGDITTNVN